MAIEQYSKQQEIGRHHWQPSDIVLLVIAAVTMLLSFVFFKYYREIQVELQESGDY